MQSGCKQKVSYGLSYIIMINMFQNENGGFLGSIQNNLKMIFIFS